MNIRRHQRDTGDLRVKSARGEWTYTDATEHEAALLLHGVHRLSLATVDDWIESAPWPDPAELQQVMQWRGRLVQAALERNGADVDAMGQLLLGLVHGERLRPLARRGRKHGVEQAKRRKGKPGTDPTDTGRDARLRAFHGRLVAAGRPDATSQTAREFSMGTSNVRRILRAK